jgi:hypothetical protein
VDIAPEKNEAARLNFPKQRRGFGIEFVGGNTSED